MRPLSASEAINPAIERTKDFLARPFRWRTFLKLAAVAFFAELGSGSLNFNLPGRGGNLTPATNPFLAWIVAFAVILGVVFMLVGLVFFYLGSRLQLVLVELVATRQTYVAPVWHRAGASTWRWIGLKLLFFLASILVALILASPVIVYFVAHGWLRRGVPDATVFSHLHVLGIVLLAAAALCLALLVAVAYTLLRDFALPSIVFEDLPIAATLGRVRNLLAAEPGPVALYLLLRLILVFVFAIAAEMALAIVILISLIPFGIIGLLLWLVLHTAGAAGTVTLVGLGVLGGLVFLVWVVALALAALGAVYTFSQAYALYFLGGRYPLLGDLLDRSTPAPRFAYPQDLPPPYYPPPPPAPSV